MPQKTIPKQEVDQILAIPVNKETTDLAILGNEVYNVLPLAPPCHMWAGLEQSRIKIQEKIILTGKNFKFSVVLFDEVPFAIFIFLPVKNGVTEFTKIVIDADKYKEVHGFLVDLCIDQDELLVVE